MKAVRITAVLLLCCAAFLSAQPLPDALYYKFENNPSATTVRNYGSTPMGNNPASLNAGLSLSPGGQFDSCLVGNGTIGSFIDSGWLLDFAGKSWTISFWIDIKDTTSVTPFYLFGDSATTFRCYHNGSAGNKNIALRIPGNSQIVIENIGGVGPTVLHFVYDSVKSLMSIYKNGDSLLATTITPPTITGAGRGLYVAGYLSNAESFVGKLDEFRVYHKALSPSEVKNVWNRDASIPNTPQVISSYVNNQNDIRIRWNDLSSNENGFKVERSDNIDTNWISVITKSANEISCLDIGVERGRTYKYRVTAFNEWGTSPSSLSDPVFVPTESANYQQTRWSWVHPKPQGMTLNWCKRWNSKVWYALGAQGVFIKTTDGGSSWIVNPSIFNIGQVTGYDAHFFNPASGIVISASGAVAKTIDSGKTFTEIKDASQLSTWNDIHFVSNKIGYIVGGGVLLTKTSDGGNTWKTSSTVPSGFYFGVGSPNDTTIILTTFGGKIIRSTDGGNSWQQQSIGGSASLGKIVFISRDSAIIIGGSSTVKLTADGGATWKDINNGLGASTQFQDIKVRGNEIFVAGDYTYIKASSDFGATWDTIRYLAPGQGINQPYSFDLGNSDSMLVVGLGGMINYRSNGNVIKFLQRSHYDGSNFDGGHFYDIWAGVENSNVKIIAVGERKTATDQMLISTNNGETWSVQNLPTTNELLSINMVTSSIGYVVGDEGVVLRTTDGGINWNQKTSPSNIKLFKVKFVDPNTGWVCGDSAKIFKTTDGGNSWIDQSLGIAISIRGMSFTDAQTGYVLAGQKYPNDTMMIYKTTNGGSVWAKLPAVNSHAMRLYGTGITVLNKNICFVFGTTPYRLASIAKTTNGGASWDSVTVPMANVNNKLNNFIAFDSLEYIATSQNRMLRTTNGGKTWVTEYLPGYGLTDAGTTFGKIYFLDRNNGYAAGQGGQVYKYQSGPLTNVYEWEALVPEKIELHQNYPNPFNPSTTIQFSVPKTSKVSLTVYDLLGRQVATMLNEIDVPVGRIAAVFDGKSFASGIYFYRLSVDKKFSLTKKMILIK